MLCHCPKHMDLTVWCGPVAVNPINRGCGCPEFNCRRQPLVELVKKNVCGVSGCYFVPTWKTEFRSLWAYLSIRWNFWAIVKRRAKGTKYINSAYKLMHSSGSQVFLCLQSIISHWGWCLKLFYGCSRLWTACFFCLTRYLSNPKYPIIFLLPAWSVNYNNTLWLLLFYRSVQ